MLCRTQSRDGSESHSDHSHLFSPLKVGVLTFKNRLIATPGSRALDHQSTIAFYVHKAQRGATCVTLGERGRSRSSC